MINNELILSRRVEIETWQIQGSVAKAQERKEIMLVLQYLDEFPGCTAKGLAGHLLFDSNARRVVAQRLLALSELYKLTDSDGGNYSLTEKGKEALSTREVFIPEDGCWKLSVSSDPLLPHTVIDLEVFKEPDARSEIIGKEAKEKLEERKKKMRQLPERVRQSFELELSPHVGGGKIRIDSIKNRAEKVSAERSITLEWNVSKDSVRLLDGNSKKILNQFDGPGLDQNTVWEILLDNEGWLDDWDSSTSMLAVSFENVDAKARKSMIDDIEFKSPTIFHNGNEYGDFKDIVVQGVGLCAATQSDAIEWARWRLAESINSYATSIEYQRWVKEALAPFNEFSVDLPERDEYANELWRDSVSRPENDKTKAWHLIAASDWAL